MYQIDYRYLRPKKAQWLKRMHASPFACREDLSVWQGRQAAILPLREVPGDDVLFGRGGVVDAQGDYVPLSGIESRIMGCYPFETSAYRDERVVYCGYLVNHWGHFLVEAVTRLWYCLEADDTIDKYVFILGEGEERTIKGNYLEFLKLLQIEDKVEFLSAPTVFKEVIVPEAAFLRMRYYSPKYLAIFDALAQNVVPEPHWEPLEKIYFTRSHFAKDNGYEFGLEGLDSFFRNNGYTILAPETIPLPQMIYYLRSAKQVASVSGSTPHNLLFAGNGQKVTILERLVMNTDYQVCIDRMRQLRVTYLDAGFHLYPVDFCGPYFLGLTPAMQRYIQDQNLQPADPEFTSQAYLDKCCRQYLRSYHEHYQHQWFMADWYCEITDSLWEAYQDSYPLFRDFLEKRRPFLREHYFQIHYWKQFIKRILRKN